MYVCIFCNQWHFFAEELENDGLILIFISILTNFSQHITIFYMYSNNVDKLTFSIISHGNGTVDQHPLSFIQELITSSTSCLCIEYSKTDIKNDQCKNLDIQKTHHPLFLLFIHGYLLSLQPRWHRFQNNEIPKMSKLIVIISKKCTYIHTHVP